MQHKKVRKLGPTTKNTSPQRKNLYARKHGIPKAFRQYCRRYGSNEIALVKLHLQLGDAQNDAKAA